jgi:uncharacterized protein YndB with AHSA1/START domain
MKTMPDASLRVELEKRLPFPVERVFRAFTDSAKIRLWWCPEDHEVVDALLEARTGGAYRIRMRTPTGETITLAGEVTAFEPDRLLALTWRWDRPEMDGGAESCVTVQFERVPEGAHLRIVHERFTQPEFRALHQHGWRSTLANLEAKLACGRL